MDGTKSQREATRTEEWFASLWRRYYKPLLYFISVQLAGSGGSSADAEDALQEIMAKAYRRQESFDDSRSVSSWLYAIARNHCIDLARRSARRAEGHVADRNDDREGDYVSGYATPEEQLLQAEVRREIDAFMRRLPAEDRQLLFLHYYHDMPYREIAEVLRVPVGTAKYRAHLLREQLRSHLESGL